MPQEPQFQPAGNNFVTISDLRAGQVSSLPPIAIGPNEVSLAVNVDWFQTKFGRKRGGATEINMAGFKGSLPIKSLFRHVPGTDDSQAELWAVDADGTINRLSRGFMASLGNFNALINSGHFVNNSIDTSSLSIGQLVLIDSNTYTITAVGTGSFNVTPPNPIAYTGIAAQPDGAVWSQPFSVDVIIGDPVTTEWATINGKLIIANQFTTDTFGHYRLHEFDPKENQFGNTAGMIRRCGIAASIIAPTVSDNGSGSYANTTRSYRVRWTERAYLNTWNPAIGVMAPVQQVILTLGSNNYTAGLAVSLVNPTIMFVNANLTVNIYASAAGGGGAGGDNNDGDGGGGGGGGASNNSGISVLLIQGHTYTINVGAGGAPGGVHANGSAGGDTWLYDNTASSYVFYFQGGQGGVAGAGGGAGGSNTHGVGTTGGGGGASGSFSGAGQPGGGSAPNQTGGGGGGGWGVGGVVGGSPEPGGNGGSSGGAGGGPGSIGAPDGSPQGGSAGGGGADSSTTSGGGGGGGGGVSIQVAGLASGVYGGGGGGGGGWPEHGTGGGFGGQGIMVIQFSPTTYSPSVGGFDGANTTGIWTPHGGSLNPSSVLAPMQQILVNGNAIFTILTTNSTAFTTAPWNYASYSNATVQGQSSLVIRRSEPSPSVSFTPNGTSQSAAVTVPQRPQDLENWYELEASNGSATFYVLNTYPIGYSTSFDTITPSAYTNGSFTLSDEIGTYTLQLPYKFVAADQNRLLGFGSFNPTDSQSRVEFSAILHSLDVSDLERIDKSVAAGNLGYVDLDEADSGTPTALAASPLNGQFLAFKLSQVWQLDAQNSTTTPYQKTAITKVVGALPRTVVIADDGRGSPAAYWMSLDRPHRYYLNAFNVGRVDDIGIPIQDMLVGPTSTLQYAIAGNSTPSLYYNHAVYYNALRQVWFYVAVSNVAPFFKKLVYSLENDMNQIPAAWSVHTGESAQAYASVMFAQTIGAFMSHNQKPYIAAFDFQDAIWQCDTADLTDDGTPFQGYLITKGFSAGNPAQKVDIGKAWVSSNAAANTNLQLSIIGDYGDQISNSNVTITSRKPVRFQDSGMHDVNVVQLQIGDAAPVASAWQIDFVVVEVLPKETN